MSNVAELIPVKTEKSFKLANTGIYTFAVIKPATKVEIKAALKALYNVDVKSLTSLKQRSKVKMNVRNRRKYLTPSYTKVYVTLAEGQKLEFYK